METGHAPWWPSLFMNKTHFSYSCRRSSSDYFYLIILISDNRFFKVFVTAISHAPSQSCFLTDQISFNCFCGGSPSDHFCQIIFNSDHWFQRKDF